MPGVCAAQILARGGYDVVVCHSAWPHALFAPVVRIYGARLVFYMHDGPNRRGWPDLVANRTRPDLVICNSRFTAASAPWFFAAVPRRVLHCPVELDRTRRSVLPGLKCAHLSERRTKPS